ncbi:MAG: hypothetical protein ABSE64_05875 [Vulcanimicrobiaceae bacterium]|jgi:hypothetical protein
MFDPSQDSQSATVSEQAAHALIDAGWVLRFAGDDLGATETFLRAVEMAPLLPRAHLAYAEALLARGELLRGWKEFAWRKILNEHTRKIVERIELPEWTGGQMTDGRLLVVCDEGIGDAIMFARYLPLVAERVGQVAVGWGPEHAALLKRINGVSDVHVSAPNPHDFDAYLFICDLPDVFETTLETIPAAIPYIPLDEVKVQQWRQRLAIAISGDQLRVGINWSGNPSNRRDAQRSLAFGQLAPLLDVEGINFVSLQKEVREAGRSSALTRRGIRRCSSFASRRAATGLPS